MIRKKPRASLPAALSKRAKALAKDKQERLGARGKELIAVVKVKRTQAASLFYEIGQALHELSQKAVFEALGHKTFDSLLTKELKMNPAYAAELRLVPSKINETLAMELGVDKSVAVAAALNVPGVSLSGKKLLFVAPSFRETVDTTAATARQIETLAKFVRQKSQKPGVRRGRTTTPSERSHAAALEKRLRSSGVTSAEVRCVATKPGKPSDIVIRVGIDFIPILRKTLTSF